MSEHEDWMERDDEIGDELRRRAKTPEFPGPEIEARIRHSLAGMSVHHHVRPGQRQALGAATEESETARSDGWARAGERVRPDPWAVEGGEKLSSRRFAALTRSFSTRAVLTAAASLAVFIAGAEYGRRTAPISVVVPALATPVEVRNDLPYSIQSAGSQYVATLATFSGQSDSLSSEERRVAREVALAALYSASMELLREAGDDEMLRAVTEMVARRRNTMSPSAIGSSTRF